jgi:hypothetical protein
VRFLKAGTRIRIYFVAQRPTELLTYVESSDIGLTLDWRSDLKDVTRRMFYAWSAIHSVEYDAADESEYNPDLGEDYSAGRAQGLEEGKAWALEEARKKESLDYEAGRQAGVFEERARLMKDKDRR